MVNFYSSNKKLVQRVNSLNNSKNRQWTSRWELVTSNFSLMRNPSPTAQEVGQADLCSASHMELSCQHWGPEDMPTAASLLPYSCPEHTILKIRE